MLTYDAKCGAILHYTYIVIYTKICVSRNSSFFREMCLVNVD